MLREDDTANGYNTILNHKAAGRPNEVKESLLNPIFGSGPWSNAGVTAAIAVVASTVAVATVVVVVATGTTAATAPTAVVVAVVGISSKFEGVQVPRSRLSRNARALTATTDRVHKLTLVSALTLQLPCANVGLRGIQRVNLHCSMLESQNYGIVYRRTTTTTTTTRMTTTMMMMMMMMMMTIDNEDNDNDDDHDQFFLIL
ncbi:hypothetical protein HZH66_011860 [Vespula vulgaris]|uniref:Uncharacterized protein n=1 Tax=Vespula vulgaris TaxID=7454 RepID=A0A834JD53_VESVU|nr:hypothetical protein HZH66_011860 [Vespula vulgaris]